MRRSARLMQTKLGGVKKTSQEGATKASETSINLGSTAPRRRGLFQDSPGDDTEMLHDTFIVAEHMPERPVPRSPFLPDQNQDFPQPPLNDENTPPPKRRHITPTDAEAEMPAEEEMPSRGNSLHLAAENEAANQTVAPEPAPTWFTPIRPTRPPVVEPEYTPTGMPSRMPSFAMWIDGVEINPEDELLLPECVVAPTAPLPPASKQPTPATNVTAKGTPGIGGVDMTDLARLYDPQIAGAIAKSPPTPIEKLCKSLAK